MSRKSFKHSKQMLTTLSLLCLAISGCVSQPETTMWQYHPKQIQSLNAPMPFSSYVNVTQQIQDDNLQYVTCNLGICPAWNRKTLITE
ncbi:hypothetical protein [Moraxella catarrhalis]|uniref:hypothetical protein n=1 Tax=Moraxella catarrhalis TaxID=480 RepID=UPI00128CFECE|nr:hypothetical protein [Moraxella catarrhalis]